MFPVLNFLKTVLSERNLKLVNIARTLNLRYQSLNAWINGYGKMPERVQSKVAEYLNIDRERLFPEYEGDSVE